MRDLVLLGLLPVILIASMTRPFIALGLCIWTALFFPNGWVYGIASGIRYNLLFAVLAIAGYLFSLKRPPVKWGAIPVLVLLFFAWTTMSTTASIGVSEISWDIWFRFLKVVMLFVFIILIMNSKLHIDFFLWCLVLSVGFYAGLEGSKFVMSGGQHMIAGLPDHVLGDRNDLALALVMVLPVCLYLLGEYGKQSLACKLFLLAVILSVVISVLGTQSRGGLIALLTVGAFLFAKSEQKGILFLLVLFIACISTVLISEQWLARMDTIGNASEDTSFMGRVVAWKLSFIMALQHPILGGGFKSLEFFPVWQDLSQHFHTLSFFYTGEAVPDPTKAFAAHSIYFQVLGDHGFVALGLYVGMLITAYKRAGATARRIEKMQGEEWAISLAAMLRASILAFCVGGAALSMAYFDLIFALVGLVVVLDTKIEFARTVEPAAADSSRR